MLILLALVVWTLLLALIGFVIYREVEPDLPSSSQPPDPIASEINKWMHDWERGRA